MSYQRCGIDAKKDIKSKFLEIRTDRCSYLLGDVVLLTINNKINQTQKYDEIFILISSSSYISRSTIDSKLSSNNKTISKDFFDIKYSFLHQNYPLTYSFTIPFTSSYTGLEGSFILPTPIIYEIYKINCEYLYRIDLFVKINNTIYIADQKDIIVRQTFKEIIPISTIINEFENFQIKIFNDRSSYYPQENILLMFEVNSKIQRPTTPFKIILLQVLNFFFVDTTITITNIIDSFNFPSFQPYFYGKRPFVIKLPDNIIPSHSSTLFKVEYFIKITGDINYEGGSSTPISILMKQTILSPPTLYNSTTYLPLITYDFFIPNETILRPFWQEDKSTDVCGNCSTGFGFITRRHHCRRCGKVFCASCCKDTLLMKNLGFDKPERVCIICLKLEVK